MDNLKAWGFTAVRLFVAWPGVNPSKGQVRLAAFQYFCCCHRVSDAVVKYSMLPIVWANVSVCLPFLESALALLPKLSVCLVFRR